MATAISAISHATLRTCPSSGLCSRSTRSDSDAIRPSSVCMPVAYTSARASPSVQFVPENTRSRASQQRHPAVEQLRRRGRPAATRPSASRGPPRCRLRAGGRRPRCGRPPRRRARRRARGVAPRSASTRPSRSTFACGGRYAASASTARSACISWRNANTALITITTTIATATASIAGHPRERGGRPQQQRERVRELAGELARPAAAPAAAQLVGAELHEPPLGLA